MKMLNTPQEIAVAINMHEMPVVRIDFADADEYGIKSQKVLIDNGKFKRLKPTDPDIRRLNCSRRFVLVPVIPSSV